MGASGDYSDSAYSWDAIVEELHVPLAPSAEPPAVHRAKAFSLDWPDAVQDSNESDAAYSNPHHHATSPLPLWGSVLLTKDKEVVQRLIQQQTQVVVLRDMYEIEPEQHQGNPERDNAEPAHSSASDQCTVPAFDARRASARPAPVATEPSQESTAADCATTSAAEGFGDSSVAAEPALGKRTAEQAMDAGNEDGDRGQDDHAAQHHDAPRPQRRRHDITWLMALHDASDPVLPAPDLHKVLPTSYDDGYDAPEAKASKGVDDAGPSASQYNKTSECSYASSMLHTLYQAGPSCNITTALTFESITDEAAFYVGGAQRWLRRHAIVLTLLCVLTTLAVAHTALPASVGQCAWLQRTPGNARMLLLAVADVVLVAVNSVGAATAALLGMPDKHDDTLLLPSTWSWIAMHVLLQLLICAPVHMLALLPKARRLQLLEPVSQAAHIAMFVTHSWCPLLSCLSPGLQRVHTIPSTLMLCRNWCYLLMFPTRWCRARWTQAILLGIVVASLLVHGSAEEAGVGETLCRKGAQYVLTWVQGLALPRLATVCTAAVAAMVWVVGFAERALPWVVQTTLQCVWLYAAEVASRSAFLVRQSI